MALAASGLILGLTLGQITAPGDLAAITSWGGSSTVLGTWLPQNVLVLPGSMTASGAAVTGFGQFLITGSLDALGRDLALGAGSPPTDLAAIAKWTAIATALMNHIQTFGQANPVAFVAPGAGGPCTGTGTLAFTNMLVGPSLASALNATDPAGIVMWTAVGTAMLLHLQTNATVLPSPIGLIAPSGGGPLTGTGTIL